MPKARTTGDFGFPICHAVSGKLTWTHYRTLITVENEAARQYYFEEAIKSKWSVRDLQRQIREDIPHTARPQKEASDATSQTRNWKGACRFDSGIILQEMKDKRKSFLWF